MSLYDYLKLFQYNNPTMEINPENFNDPIEEKKFVIDIYLKRRPLNDFQKYELIYSLEKIDQEERCKKKFSERRFEKETFKDKDLL